MFRPTFDQMDLNKSGFVSKDDYMKLNSWKAGEEQALAAFKLMDTDNDGQVTGIFIMYCMVAMVNNDITTSLLHIIICILVGLIDQFVQNSPVSLHYQPLIATDTMLLPMQFNLLFSSIVIVCCMCQVLINNYLRTKKFLKLCFCSN